MNSVSEEINTHALCSICGAIHYTLLTYNILEISKRDWEYFSSYVPVGKDAICCAEIKGDGFLLTTKDTSLRYHHDDLHGKRKVELKMKD